MMDPRLVREHRARALTPDRPVMRGTAQNPDVFFQSRERANSFYMQTPAIVEKTMQRFAELTGRRYKLFEYAQRTKKDVDLRGVTLFSKTTQSSAWA